MAAVLRNPRTIMFQRYINPSNFAPLSNSAVAAKRVYMSQIDIPVDCVAKSIVISVTTNVGNCYVAIFREVTADTAAGSVLVGVSADTLVVNGAQEIPFTSLTPLKAGSHYLAFVDSGASTVNKTLTSIILSNSGFYHGMALYGSPTTPTPAVNNLPAGAPLMTLKLN